MNTGTHNALAAEGVRQFLKRNGGRQVWLGRQLGYSESVFSKKLSGTRGYFFTTEDARAAAEKLRTDLDYLLFLGRYSEVAEPISVA